MTYQQAYNQLLALIEEIEDETTPLDDLPEKIKTATDLIAYCQERLRSVETAYHQAIERIQTR
jgi:exodeoxyribonuclease VII small subunit